MERRLYYIPTGHSGADVDTAGNAQLAMVLNSYAGRFFRGIDSFVSSLPDAVVSTSIVSVDGYEQDTVRALNARGGESFLTGIQRMGHSRQTAPQEFVLADLMNRGSRLVSVENSGLVKQTRQVIAGLTRASSDEEAERLRKRLEGLNGQRDDSMVSTVNKMHKPANTWILFWGAAHDARAKLAKRGIEVIVPQEVFSYLSEEDFNRFHLLNRFRS